MKAKTKCVMLAGGFFIVLILLIYSSYFSIGGTKELYKLSIQELSQLQNAAIVDDDMEASFQVALYYGAYKRDRASMIAWLEISDKLGNPSARAMLDSLRPSSENVDESTRD